MGSVMLMQSLELPEIGKSMKFGDKDLEEEKKEEEEEPKPPERESFLRYWVNNAIDVFLVAIGVGAAFSVRDAVQAVLEAIDDGEGHGNKVFGAWLAAFLTLLISTSV